MIAETASRRDRLPRWARQEIERLERDLAYARDRLAEGPEGSRVFADPYSDTPRPLGADTAIEFRVGEEWGNRFNVRIQGNGIKIMSGDSLWVRPEASNVVSIEARAR